MALPESLCSRDSQLDIDAGPCWRAGWVGEGEGGITGALWGMGFPYRAEMGRLLLACQTCMAGYDEDTGGGGGGGGGLRASRASIGEQQPVDG